MPKTGTIGSGGWERPGKPVRAASAVKGRRSCSFVFALRRFRFVALSSSWAVMGRNRLADAGAMVLKKWAWARESSLSLEEWELVVVDGKVSGEGIESLVGGLDWYG